MKTLLTILSAFVLTFTAFGKDVRFIWDTNSEPDIEGYRLSYRLLSSTNIIQTIQTATNGTPVVSLAPNDYRASLVAFTTNGIVSPVPATKDFSIPRSTTGLFAIGYTNGALNVGWAPNTEFDLKHYLFNYGSLGSSATTVVTVTTNRASIPVGQPQTFWCFVQPVTTNNLTADPSVMFVLSVPRSPAGLGIGE